MVLRQKANKKFQKICKFGGVKLNILVDYLTVSVKQMELDEIFKILRLDVSKMQKGYSKWLAGKYYLGGISVHYGDYITLEMSGSGCRLLESLYDNNLNWIDFIEQFLCLEGSHLARLDIACDDRPGAGESRCLVWIHYFVMLIRRNIGIYHLQKSAITWMAMNRLYILAVHIVTAV